MPKTFCNTPPGSSGRHIAKTELGHYVMSAFWIDTTAPCDMMDYDFTDTFDGLRASHEWIRLMNNRTHPTA